MGHTRVERLVVSGGRADAQPARRGGVRFPPPAMPNMPLAMGYTNAHGMVGHRLLRVQVEIGQEFIEFIN